MLVLGWPICKFDRPIPVLSCRIAKSEEDWDNCCCWGKVPK
jgi:hypothetical protein